MSTSSLPKEKIVPAAPEVFNFVGSDGKDIRTLVLEINQLYSEHEVQRNTSGALTDELKKLRDDVEVRGINRESMATVESFGLGPLKARYPLNSYTERRSFTNSKIALEEIDVRRVGIIAGIIAAATAIIIKLVQWTRKLFGRNTELVNTVAANAVSAEYQSKAAEEIATKVGGEMAVQKATTDQEKYRELIDRVTSNYTLLMLDVIRPNGGLSPAMGKLLGDIERFSSVTVRMADKAEKFVERFMKEIKRDDSGKVSSELLAEMDQFIRANRNPVDSYPPLADFVKHLRIPEEIGRDQGVSGVINEIRNELKRRDETPQTMSHTRHDLMKSLNREILKATGRGQGENNYYYIPPTVIKDLELIEKKMEMLERTMKNLINESTPVNVEYVAKLSDLIRTFSERGRLLGGIIGISAWTLTRIQAFQKDVWAVIALYLMQSERMAKEQGIDITEIRQTVTAAEERHLAAQKR